MNRILFSSASDNWPTPSRLYDELNKEFAFTLDPCPVNGNVDGKSTLFMKWQGHRIFCNPPYGPEIGKWLERSADAELAVYLLPARTDTRWFHEQILPYATEIRFLKGRLKFGESKTGAPFPSMVVVFKKGTARRELAQLSMLYDSGHPDRRGIKQGIADWIEQDALDTLDAMEGE